MCFCCCDILCCDCILVFIAILFPPLPVCIKRGFCSCDFLINICLCILGWLPGTIHAWYIIATTPTLLIDDEERQVFIVSQPQLHPHPHPHAQAAPVHTHPYQSRVQFTHPEPFLEHAQHINSHKPHTSPLDGTLSPLSDSPTFPSNYSSNDTTDQPPSYENVMNDLSKNSPH